MGTTSAGRELSIRVLVVDDEPLARRTLRDLLASDGDVLVVGEIGDGPAAVSAIHTLRPDIVFLDVQMPGCDGFEVLKRLEGLQAPVIVFVTAYDQHAIQAFAVHAADYLLKPFEDTRFYDALAHAKQQVWSGRRPGEERGRAVADRLAALLATYERRLADQSQGLATPASSPTVATTLAPTEFWERLAVKSVGRTVYVPTASVDWVEAADYYARIHAGGRAQLVRHTLAELSQRLNPRQFVRVHRSAIVNVSRVRELRPTGRGDLVVLLETGVELRVSRDRREALEHALSGGA